MLKKFLLLLFALSGIMTLQAQTQLRQGKWQQSVSYNIQVKLDDNRHMLCAFERLEYVNRSPDELTELYIHLWPNAYSSDRTAFARQEMENGSTDFHFAPDSLRGFIDSLDFKINGEKVNWELLPDSPDICRIRLKQPLYIGQSLVLTTPFRVKIPAVFSRLGHDGQFYAVTQWYPKIAVYDVNGWNYMPYLNQGEFYSDFGHFEVRLSLPANYVVAATGNLQNAEEKEWMRQQVGISKGERLCKACDIPLPESDSKQKTLLYTADQVHDFAWFADKRFAPCMDTVHLASGKSVEVWTFNPGPPQWEAVEWTKKALRYYSARVGEYPYAICSVVRGPLQAGGGMEYPTITVCSDLDELVVLHEVGHNWFYGILGSNERRYPWMDEGINSFYQDDYFKEYPFLKSLGINKDILGIKRYKHNTLRSTAYLFTARYDEDQALNLPADQYSMVNYGCMVYFKGSMMFDHLQRYLGQPLFDSCMQAYYNTWKFRHPLPGDLQDVMEQQSGRKLDWFFNTYINSSRKTAYRINGLKKIGSDSVELSISNRSSLALPFSLSSLQGEQVLYTRWVEGFSGRQKIRMPRQSAGLFCIDHEEVLPELNRRNNYIRTKGLLKRVEWPRVQLLARPESSRYSQLFVSPIVGVNRWNHWMPGLCIYNSLIPGKRLEYGLAPMYSISTRDLNGYAWAKLHLYLPAGPLSQVMLLYNYARFRTLYYPSVGYFMKNAPQVRLLLRKSSPRSRLSQEFRVRYVSIHEGQAPEGFYYELTESKGYAQAAYVMENAHAVHPSAFQLIYERGSQQGGSHYGKLFSEYNYRYQVGKKGKSFDMRVFAGLFMYKREMQSGDMGLQYLRMGSSTLFDYTYDQAMVGRGSVDVEGFYAQQVLIRDGGFKLLSGIGATDRWLASMNLKCPMPGFIPFKIYADFGTYYGAGNAAKSFKGSKELMYNIGILFPLKRNVLEVYFPVVVSSDIKQVWDLNNIPYRERITFMFNLSSLNPFNKLRNVTL